MVSEPPRSCFDSSEQEENFQEADAALPALSSANKLDVDGGDSNTLERQLERIFRIGKDFKAVLSPFKIWNITSVIVRSGTIMCEQLADSTGIFTFFHASW